MPGIILPQQNGYDNLCNCSYTTTSGNDVKVDIAALIKLMKSIPEIPKLFRMDISLLRGHCLPKNSIIMSADVADALEEAIK